MPAAAPSLHHLVLFPCFFSSALLRDECSKTCSSKELPDLLDLEMESKNGPPHLPDLASVLDPHWPESLVLLVQSSTAASPPVMEQCDFPVASVLKDGLVGVSVAAIPHLRFVSSLVHFVHFVITLFRCFCGVVLDHTSGNGPLAWTVCYRSTISCFTNAMALVVKLPTTEGLLCLYLRWLTTESSCLAVLVTCKLFRLPPCVISLLSTWYGTEEQEGLTAREGTWMQLWAAQVVADAIWMRLAVIPLVIRVDTTRMRLAVIPIVCLGLTARDGATTPLRPTHRPIWNYGMLRRTKNVPPGNYGMHRHTKNVSSGVNGTRWRAKNVPGWNYGMLSNAKNEPPQRALTGSTLFILLQSQLITLVLHLRSPLLYVSLLLTTSLLCNLVVMVYRSRELATHPCNVAVLLMN